jgi:inositol phosphorylceramide mannosyltransferase catalytic subunit
MHNICFLLFIIILIIIYISLKISQHKESFLDINFSGPNIIQTWKNNDIPNKYKHFVERVKKLNPKSRYMFFTDNDINHFVRNKFPEYYITYKKFPYKIQKIDFFRYLAIYYYGGVYLDLDIYLYKTLYDISSNGKTVFPLEYMQNDNKLLQDQNYKGLIGNYAFYAPKGSLFVKLIIDNIVKDRIPKIDYKKGFDSQRYIFYKTGPVMVTQSYIDYQKKYEIDIIKPDKFKFGYFGNYGRHYLMGSWK